MNPTELRDRIKKALDETGEFNAVDPIEDGKAVLGIETPDGELFFVEVIPA